MSISYRVYVDEAGDEGFVFEKGSTDWFVISAVVTDVESDLETVKLIDEVREILGKARRSRPYILHFRELRHEQRVAWVRKIAEARLQAVSVLVHKPSIASPGEFARRHRLYFHATSLLLERVSWLCREKGASAGDGSAEIIFSNRSSMSYEELGNYLDRLKEESGSGDLEIDWNVIRRRQIKALPARAYRGLQIADAVASGFFKAVQPSAYGFTETRHVYDLANVIYRPGGRTSRGHGVKIWPPEAEKLAPEDQLSWYLDLE